jgi:rhodanese-related sulfurtransferase
MELTPRRVKNKDQVLLVYCQSGARGSSAKKILAGMGYTHTFNLGSYQRATRIVGKR